LKLVDKFSQSSIEYPIVVEGLKKIYGSIVAISDISLNVRNNDCLGIVGPNGAGKTTLFQCILGLLKNIKGNVSILGQEVIINGKILQNMRKYRNKIGYVPDFLEIYPFLTSEEYLHFLGKIAGFEEEKISKYMNFLLNYFDLNPWYRTLVKNLSRGNLQKLILCTALIHQPSILILDEPFTNLDIIVRGKAKALLEAYITNGIPELDIITPGTILISSHILADIEDICNRVVIIKSGRIVWNGEIDELKTETKEDKGLETIILEVLGK